MSALEEILKLLNQWPTWNKIQQTPAKLDALEERVAELEKRLGRCPGEGCPRCGELTFRTQSSQPDLGFGDMGAIQREMKCESCGFTETKLITPKR